MALTAALGMPPYHPWLDEFAQTPEQAFGELLAGYARISPYDRADAPDAARMLFGALPPRDPIRLKLGPAILGWLKQRRREPPPALRPPLQRWIREVCEAFEIIALLDVAEAAAELRLHFVVWNEWAARFSLSPARDARAEYWRMLALTQPLLRSPESAIDPVGLAPLWRGICKQAGGLLPIRYLSIGLLGLRRLPAPPVGSEAPWVAGLAHWAMARNPSNAEFQAEWHALKPLYPRTAQRWRELVGRLLGTPAFSNAGISPPAWWRGDPDFAPMTRVNFQPKGEPLRSPGPEACNAVMQVLGDPWERVERAINGLMQAEHRFLSATGDSQFFVRSMHRLGTALIEPGGDEPHERARKAQALAREGIGWDPYNRYLWSLWRDALAADGALEAAELVGWEAIRCDPENVDARTQLATLLVEAVGRPADAVLLLRDTVARFPEDPHRYERLIAGIEASAATREADLGMPTESLADVTSGLMGHNQYLPENLTDLAVSDDDWRLTDVIRYGRLRRASFRMSSADRAIRQAALDEVQAILRYDPTFAYAELLAARHGLWRAKAGTLPSFAAAFEQALREEDRASLEDLAKRQPRLEALTLVARAILGDEPAARRVHPMLTAPAAQDDPRVISLLRTGLQPFLVVPFVPQAFQDNGTAIRRRLYDVNEALLGDRIAA